MIATAMMTTMLVSIRHRVKSVRAGLSKTIFIIVILTASGSGFGVASPPATALPPGAMARLAWTPLRIGYADFTLTPDGRTIIVVTPQGNLRRLDAQTGRLLECRQLSDRSDVDLGDDSTIHPAVLSANGETVALYESSYTGPRLAVYDTASGKMILRRESNEKRRILSGNLSPDGKQLAVSEEEDAPQDTVVPDEEIAKRACLRLFDLKSGRMREIGTFPQGILGILFSGDGKRLLVTQSGQPIVHILTIFDLPSGKKLWRRTVRGMSYAINRDGTMVLASGRHKQLIFDFSGIPPEVNHSATGFHVLQMDLEAKKLTERFDSCTLGSEGAPNPLGIAAFALAPDVRTLVINHFNGKGSPYIVSWDLRTGKEIRRFALPKIQRGQLLPFRMVLAADGRTLLTKGEYLQRWDLTTGKPFFAPPPDDSLPGPLMQLAFTPDGKELFASSLGGVSGRWNAATGKRIDLIHDHYGGIPFVRTPDGLRTIRPDDSNAAAWLAFDILDPIAHKTVHTVRYSEPKRSADAYSLTANGKTLLAIHRDNNTSHVTAWNVITGGRISQFIVARYVDFPGSPFSPCGRWVVLGGKLYHAGSGAELFAPAGRSGERMIYGANVVHGPVWFSVDGRLLAAHLHKTKTKSAAEDALAVWELASGQLLARFAKGGFVAQAAFAPDGRTIALLDAQGVRLEDLLVGKQRIKYPAPDVVCGRVTQTLVFAPNGATLATGHQDGSIMLWKVPPSRPANPAALTDGEAEKLWADLGSASPVKARAAIDRLARHPGAAAAMLAMRFRPPPADAKLAALITDLDSEVFATREEASRKLHAYGARAETTLRRKLEQSPSLEMRRRIENILAEMLPPALRLPLSGERLRGVRAIEVLERIGNAAARLLHSWAEQTEDVHLAIEARMAVERLGSAKANSPATP